MKKVRLLKSMLLVALAWIASTVSNADTSQLNELTQQSDLIVVAHVIGLADSKAAAQNRRHREIHLIKVKHTLKGYEMAGQQLAVRPNAQSWSTDQSYIFFLNPDLPLQSMTQAVPLQPILKATPANIDSVTAILNTQGTAVSSRIVIWITEISETKERTILTLSETHAFRLQKNYNAQTTELAGTLSKSAQDKLSTIISSLETTIPSDDATLLIINWLDTNMNLHSKTLMADSPYTLALMKQIERLLEVK